MIGPTRARLFLLIALVCLPLVACGGGSDLTAIRIEKSAGGSAAVRVEIANTPAALSEGLTGRPGLADGRGMLFVIEQRGPGFWMKDVSFPLSVAFIDRCGAIVDIQDMAANSEDFHDTAHDFQFGLEVKGGWFTREAIKTGDRLQLPASLKGEACT